MKIIRKYLSETRVRIRCFVINTWRKIPGKLILLLQGKLVTKYPAGTQFTKAGTQWVVLRRWKRDYTVLNLYSREITWAMDENYIDTADSIEYPMWQDDKLVEEVLAIHPDFEEIAICFNGSGLHGNNNMNVAVYKQNQIFFYEKEKLDDYNWGPLVLKPTKNTITKDVWRSAFPITDTIHNEPRTFKSKWL